jgi:hypothetical protein
VNASDQPPCLSRTSIAGAVTLALLLAASACGGGASPDDEAAAPRCLDFGTRRPAAFTETTSLGFSPEESVAFVPATRVAPITWDVPADWARSSTAGTTSTMTMEIFPQPMAVLFTPREGTTTDPCAPAIEVAATLRLVTADEALAESVQVSLRSERLGAIVIDRLLGPGTLRGTLRVTAGTQPVPLRLFIELGPNLAEGQLMASGRTDTPNGTLTATASLGRWTMSY